MVNDIIKIFEQKFNRFAEKTHAFTTRFICDEDSAIGTLCFSGFNVEFEYCLECGGITEKSGLSIILDFSKRYSTPLKCMMYDIIGLIDKDNFNCWFYCFIENAERMELCFDKLSKDFSEVLPKIKSFAVSKYNLQLIEEVLNKNIKETVGISLTDDFNKEISENEDISLEDTYDYLFGLYFGFEQCAFASYEYRDFLSGDYKKALRKYEKKKNKLIYEKSIIDYINNCTSKVPILSEEYQCLRDGLKEYTGANGSVPFLVSSAVMLIPFTAFCIGIYYAIAAIIYSSAVYASPLEWYNALSCLIPAMICSFAAGYFIREKIYRRLFRKRYRGLMDYDAIFETKKSKKRMRVLFYLIYILAIVSVFLFANCGFVIGENGVYDKSNYLNMNGKYYSYDEIYEVYCIGEGNEEEFIIYFDDGNSLNLSYSTENSNIHQKILPIFEEHNVEITNVNSENEIGE